MSSTKQIEINQLWRHKNGFIYRILLISNEHAEDNKQDEYPLTVSYTRHTEPDGKIWSKPIDSFLRSREYAGIYTPQKWTSSSRYRFKQF